MKSYTIEFSSRDGLAQNRSVHHITAKTKSAAGRIGRAMAKQNGWTFVRVKTGRVGLYNPRRKHRRNSWRKQPIRHSRAARLGHKRRRRAKR